MFRLGGSEKIIAPKHFEDSRRQSAINGRGFGDLGLGMGYFVLCLNISKSQGYSRVMFYWKLFPSCNNEHDQNWKPWAVSGKPYDPPGVVDWVFWAADDDLFFRFQLSGNAVLRETGQHPKSEPISGGINISFPIHMDSTKILSVVPRS